MVVDYDNNKEAQYDMQRMRERILRLQTLHESTELEKLLLLNRVL